MGFLLSLLFLVAPQPDLATIAESIRGRVGISAAILGTSAHTGLNENEHYPMQSVYKFAIAMAVLNRVDAGKLTLDQPVYIAKAELAPAKLHSPIRDEHPGGNFDVPLRDVLRYAVSESDGTASDVLLRLLGGPIKANDYIRGLGITEVVIATTEQEMAGDQKAQYRSWASPRGMIALLSVLNDGKGLAPASRTVLLDMMVNTETGPNRIKGDLPKTTRVAHKTGTSLTLDGITAATNDVGLVTLPDGRILALAVFVSDAAGSTAEREAIIAKSARAAWNWANTTPAN